MPFLGDYDLTPFGPWYGDRASSIRETIFSIERLKKMPAKICYWLREAKSTNAEVDYVTSYGNLIVPIEVKAGKSGTLKSLQQFVLRKESKYAVRFDLSMPSLQSVQHTASTEKGSKSVAFNLLSLPLYMVEELLCIVNLIRLEK